MSSGITTREWSTMVSAVLRFSYTTKINVHFCFYLFSLYIILLHYHRRKNYNNNGIYFYHQLDCSQFILFFASNPSRLVFHHSHLKVTVSGVKDSSLRSTLTVNRVNIKSSGNYSCRPSTVTLSD